MMDRRRHGHSTGKRDAATQVQKLQNGLFRAAVRGKGAVMTENDILTRYRESIDNIDAALVFMLAERFKITQAVGEYKATSSLPPADPAREERQIERLRQLAQDAKLDPDFTEKFLRFIIEEVIRHHQQISGGTN
jgi:chorismate mutase